MRKHFISVKSGRRRAPPGRGGGIFLPLAEKNSRSHQYIKSKILKYLSIKYIKMPREALLLKKFSIVKS